VVCVCPRFFLVDEDFVRDVLDFLLGFFCGNLLLHLEKANLGCCLSFDLGFNSLALGD
jgi:hypothetical protein